MHFLGVGVPGRGGDAGGDERVRRRGERGSPVLIRERAVAGRFVAPVRRSDDGGGGDVALEARGEDAVASANDEVLVRQGPPGDADSRRKVAVRTEQAGRNVSLGGRNPQAGRRRGEILRDGLGGEIHLSVFVHAGDRFADARVEGRGVTANGALLEPAVITQAEVQGQLGADLVSVFDELGRVRCALHAEGLERIVAGGAGHVDRVSSRQSRRRYIDR